MGCQPRAFKARAMAIRPHEVQHTLVRVGRNRADIRINAVYEALEGARMAAELTLTRVPQEYRWQYSGAPVIKRQPHIVRNGVRVLQTRVRDAHDAKQGYHARQRSRAWQMGNHCLAAATASTKRVRVLARPPSALLHLGGLGTASWCTCMNSETVKNTSPTGSDRSDRSDQAREGRGAREKKKGIPTCMNSQSAKGLAVHLLVKGVGLVAPPGPDENAVPAQPISLRALILDGGPLGRRMG